MSGLRGMQLSNGPAGAKDVSKLPCSLTRVRPGSMHTIPQGDSRAFVYFPTLMGNDEPGRGLFTGVELVTRSDVNLDETQVLIKATIDSYDAIPDNATLIRIKELVENIYNEIHGNKALRIDSVRIVQNDQVTDELRYHVLLLDCPACHRQTRVILTRDIVDARAANPNPVATILFKGDKTECGHSFIAFIDRFLKVKGYEAVDM
ncbi:MAG: hypothetical protein JW839_22165 [Candidatus Lokiarchaeota archaeon]|nr:hypothetical protein [Candidatus Lokiarchaeota archaeon]